MLNFRFRKQIKQLESFEFCGFLFCRFLFDFELTGWLVAAELADWLVLPCCLVGFDRVDWLVAIELANWLVLPSCLVGFDKVG